MALRNLWFLRQMSLDFSFGYFKVRGSALGFTRVESGPLVQNSSMLRNKSWDAESHLSCQIEPMGKSRKQLLLSPVLGKGAS